MTKHKEWRRPRLRKSKYKPFDFIPNKEQVIKGAFYDLGRPVGTRSMEAIAKSIAAFYDEEI